MELPWDHPSPFVIEVAVAESEIDALGHVNNVCYVDWLQRCAWAHSAARGFSVEQMVAFGYAMVVRDTTMHYLAATFSGDRLSVGDWVSDCDGRLRATRTFQILRQGDRTTVMRAHIDYVCVSLASGRPARMPPEFVDAYRVGT